MSRGVNQAVFFVENHIKAFKKHEKNCRFGLKKKKRPNFDRLN